MKRIAKNAAGKGGGKGKGKGGMADLALLLSKGTLSSADRREGKGTSAAVIGAPDQMEREVERHFVRTFGALNDAAVLGRNKVKFPADGWVSATNIERGKKVRTWNSLARLSLGGRTKGKKGPSLLLLHLDGVICLEGAFINLVSSIKENFWGKEGRRRRGRLLPSPFLINC